MAFQGGQVLFGVEDDGAIIGGKELILKMDHEYFSK